MSPPASHESPILVIVPPAVRPGEAMQRILSSPAVRQHGMPPPWFLDRAEIDLPALLPDVTAVTLGTLPAVVDAAIRASTSDALDDLCARMWRSVDEQVRVHYLRRGLGDTLKQILRLGPRTLEVAPPPEFREDRVAEASLEVAYRIEPGPGERNVLAPAEEASLVLYPFDPTNARARRDHGLGPGAETILEVFPYAQGRARHRAVLEGIAREARWRVIDPL